jgi:hypothetical protein
MNADRKVYTTMVELDGDNPDGRLKSRMAATVTIMVETVEDTLPVPLQAVFRDRSANFVWKRTREGPAATRVKVGRQNKERVEILEGVDEGDVLYLVAPPGVAAPKLEQPVAPDPEPLADPPRAGGPPGGAPANGNGPDNGNGNGNGGPAGDGAGGDGMRRAGRQGAWMRKSLAEMTPEELGQYTATLDFTQRMIDMARQNGNEGAAKEAEEALALQRAALERGDLAEAQTQRDKLAALRRQLMGNRGPGGAGGGSDGERPRRDRGGNGERGGGEGGGAGRRGN